MVAADERETNDLRATLNLGHTFGHAIETQAGYGKWLHGEAVAAGTCMAADLSHRLVSNRSGRGRAELGEASVCACGGLVLAWCSSGLRKQVKH